jgi:hypothetical protein
MRWERSRVHRWICVLGGAAALWGCSSSGGGGGGGGGPLTSTMALNAALPASAQAVSVSGGGNSTTAEAYAVPGTLGPIGVTDVTVDLAATLASGSVTLKPSFRKAGGPAGALGAAGDPVAQMMVRIGPASDIATVCATGYPYGPFSITDTGTGGVDVDPPTATASRQTLRVINTGNAAICVQIDADQDVDASVGKVALDVTTCDEAAGAVGGDWSGTYSCANFGGCADDAGDVFIVLFQDGYSATLSDDGGGKFEGTVCGNEVRFDGGYGEPTLFVQESGTFTMTGPGTAVKHSEWRSLTDSCGGVCDDVLTQIAAF